MLRQAKLPSVGLYYVSAICKSCQKIIPLEDGPEPETKTFCFRDPTVVRCSFCGSLERYHPKELATKLLRELPPTKWLPGTLLSSATPHGSCPPDLSAAAPPPANPSRRAV